MTDWQALAEQYYMPVTRRIPVTLVRGKGVRAWDDTGKEYLDFVGGWATNVLGHCHPALVGAITEQAQTLIHTSNQYYTVPQVELARLLIEGSGLKRVFFANSGAEADEGAVKLARRWGKKYRDGAFEVITTWHSFHGRTLAMVAATGKPAYQEPMQPLPAGFVTVDFDDLDAIRGATNARTVAVMVEPVQGEGGVNVPAPDYLRELRAWCDRENLLLILDEVQTGFGRCGSLFAFQAAGAAPDIMTLAKGLGGGVPIGAFLCNDRANAFEYGDHGSTFGGNPLACAASRAVVQFVIDNDLSGNAARVGEYFKGRLQALKSRYPSVTDVRGMGLLLAIEFDAEVSSDVVRACLEEGLLLNPVTPTAIRFMPPLILTKADVDEGIEKLERGMQRVLERSAAKVAGE
jgi:acetylornithine aminotransferase/acetylornithine/N-succinyldiaminopimelate aminotransferase